MARHPVVAMLLALTAAVVVVPVMIQMARVGYRLGQVWGHLAVGAGMLLVAAGYGFYADVRQGWLAGIGFVLAVVGMIAQHRRRQ